MAGRAICPFPHPALRATFSRKREKGRAPLSRGAGEGWGEGTARSLVRADLTTYRTTVSLFAARVSPVYSQRFRFSPNA
jgi:hypothetical protein